MNLMKSYMLVFLKEDFKWHKIGKNKRRFKIYQKNSRD